MAKVFASYYKDAYKVDFVTTSLKAFKEYSKNIKSWDFRVYNHLTKDQVELLTVAQAQFFEMIMEENINAELGK